MIADKIDGLTFPGIPDVHSFVTSNNNVVQKNVTIVKADTASSYEGAVSIMNHLTQKESYDLDMIEISDTSNSTSLSLNTVQSSLFDNARVNLRMAPSAYAAWKEGGEKGVGIKPSSDPYAQEFLHSKSSLNNIMLDPKEISLVKMKVNFTNVLPIGSKPEKHTIILRQKNKNGNIVGGETFEITREARPELVPQIIEERYDENVTLAVVDVDEDADYQWFNSKGIIVGNKPSITFKPQNDETYKVEVTARKDGYLTTAKHNVKADKEGIKVMPVPVKSELTVTYDIPDGEYDLSVVGIQDNNYNVKYALDSKKKSMTFNVAALPKGIYIATIVGKNGKTLESVKFIKE